MEVVVEYEKGVVMKKLRFFRCQHCGNIVIKVVDSRVPVMCCGEVMQELVPNTVDAAQEKHVPVVTVAKGVAHVKVGAVAHPMIEAHYIDFIALETDSGVQIKHLHPEEAPEADFCVGKEKVVAVYAHCNLHGLWMTELK